MVVRILVPLKEKQFSKIVDSWEGDFVLLMLIAVLLLLDNPRTLITTLRRSMTDCSRCPSQALISSSTTEWLFSLDF
jgi:uncharacterized membrane protein